MMLGTVRAVRLGVDVGGTKTEAVAVAENGIVVAQSRVATTRGNEGILASILAALGKLGVDHAHGAGVGVGIPGLLDPTEGSVRHAVNLGIAAEPLALRALLQERLGLPVVVDNDVAAATWGAHRMLRADDVAYLGLGTGLAAGLVLSRRLRRGAYGVAGEIGHLSVDATGPQCECGQRGCLEVVASGTALAKAWPSEHPAATLIEAAETGDSRARVALDRFIFGVTTLIRVLALAADPQLIVIGGGVAGAGEPLLRAIRTALAEEAATSPFLRGVALPDRVRLAPRGVPLGAVGAAELVNS